MPDVFLSYKREDLTAATGLVEGLRAAGFDVWWDADIPPDAPWEATIERALADAEVVLVCWSRAAVASDNVRSEARWAREQGRLIQTFVEACSPPLFFGERQGIELSGWSGDPGDARFQRLVFAIRMRLQKTAHGASADPLSPEVAQAIGTPAGSKPPFRRRAWIMATIVAILALAVIGLWIGRLGFGTSQNAQRVAVLPFQTIGETPELRAVAANMSDNLESALSLSQIAIVSAADAATLRGPDQDRRLDALGVGLLYDGTVRRDAEDVAVRIHLDDPLHHATLWSAEISQPATKADPLQAQVAARTVAVLKCAARMLRSNGGLNEPNARSLYLHACDLFETQGWGDDIQAVLAMQDTLKQLIGRAPDFAPARAMLAYALGSYLSVMQNDQVGRVRDQARAEAQRALALDPKDVTARIALYNTLPPTDVAAHERVLDAALNADPLSPDANGTMASFLIDIGRLQDAVPFAQKAAAANPLSLDWTTFLLLAWMDRTDTSTTEIAHLMELWPESPVLWYDRVLIAEQEGRWDEALAITNDPRGRPKTFDANALAYQRAMIDALRSRDPNKLQTVRQLVWQSIPAAPSTAVWTLGMPTEVALLARLGFVDDALRLGNRYAAVATGSGGEPDVDIGILFSPLGAELRRDPRFIGLMARLGLVDYWRSTGKWPDFCSEPGLPYVCKNEAAKLAGGAAAERNVASSSASGDST